MEEEKENICLMAIGRPQGNCKQDMVDGPSKEQTQNPTTESVHMHQTHLVHALVGNWWLLPSQYNSQDKFLSSMQLIETLVQSRDKICELRLTKQVDSSSKVISIE
ncbi:unnamed protein product [Sphenostylis stenocarpa]|uniref:Uncharacterized protein n=1 Tax=Sphenostylis stenocarpa TaxID=92480 RepID=A0AA86VNW0_9FABA|nr:unnamed protein product [Sphenostylis stenocarpa]